MGFAVKSEGAQGESESYERMKNNVIDEVKRFFRPEFLNRIDSTVVFHALSQEHMLEIVDLMLNEVASNLVEKGISLEVTQEAKAAGVSKKDLGEIITKSFSHDLSPYADVPKNVLALAKKL